MPDKELKSKDSLLGYIELQPKIIEFKAKRQAEMGAEDKVPPAMPRAQVPKGKGKGKESL